MTHRRPGIVIFALALFAFSPKAEAASLPERVVIAHASLGVRVAPLWVAQEQGFLAKYGVASELVWVRGGSLLVAALDAGDVQVAYTAGSAPVAAAAVGSDLRVVAGVQNRAATDLVARPGINSPKDLRGKRLGVQSIGGGNWMQAMLGLEYLGLEPRRDNIQVIASGGQTVLYQALTTGTIDAAALDTTFSRRLGEKGFLILLESQKANIPMQSMALVVKKAFIQGRPDMLEGIIKGLIEGLAFVFTPANKPVVLKTLMKRLQLSDPTFAEEAYQDLLRTVEPKPYPSVEGLRNIQRLMKAGNPRVGEIKVEELIEGKFVRKLDESGFIDRLYKSYGGK